MHQGLKDGLNDLYAMKENLLKERATLDSDDPVVYIAITKEIQNQQVLTMTSIAIGMALGAFSSGFTTAANNPLITILIMAGLTLTGAAVATGLNLLKVYFNYAVVEYRDLPFEAFELRGHPQNYTIIDGNPREGICRIKVYGSLLEDSQLALNILLKKKNIPHNRSRIQAIDQSLLKIEAEYARLQVAIGQEIASPPIAPQFTRTHRAVGLEPEAPAEHKGPCYDRLKVQ